MVYKLRKIETVIDVNYYEADLTEEQAEMYKKNKKKFWDKFGAEVERDMENVGERVGDPKSQYELLEE